MDEKPITVPAGTKMVVFIDGDGKVIDVRDENGAPATYDWGIKGEVIRKPKTLDAHGVFVHDSSSTCVTYQTPKGPRTV